MGTHIQQQSATDLARQVGILQPVLVTRENGKRVRPLVENMLRDTADNLTIVLDFAGIELMDASFADEVFTPIAVSRTRRELAGARLILRHLAGASLENLRMALLSRPQIENGLRNCVLPVLREADNLDIVGKVEGHVEQTFTVLKKRKQLLARELADELRLEIGAASTRLKVLHDLGLAIRVELRDDQGKLFRYLLPV